MTSPAVLDLDSLVKPIAGTAPSGANLRDDPSPTSPYYQVKDARNAARALERAALQAEVPSAAPQADWRPVLELGPRLIAERSKDLELTAWLIEALARKHGFAGLRDGFRLARELVQRYWDGLYPQPDEEGLSTRVAPLTGLNGDEAEGTLIAPIGMIPLVEHSEAGQLSLWRFKLARTLEGVQDDQVRERQLSVGAVPLSVFHAAVASTPVPALSSLISDIEAALSEYGLLSAALDQRAGGRAPPTSAVRNALGEVLDCVRFLTKGIVLDGALTAPSDGAAAAQGAPGASGPASSGELRTRDDALRALGRVRDYFRQAEPHSPLAYLIDQTIRWGQMPLHALLPELIPDQAALAAFRMRTGVPGGEGAPAGPG